MHYVLGSDFFYFISFCFKIGNNATTKFLCQLLSAFVFLRIISVDTLIILPFRFAIPLSYSRISSRKIIRKIFFVSIISISAYASRVSFFICISSSVCTSVVFASHDDILIDKSFVYLFFSVGNSRISHKSLLVLVFPSMVLRSLYNSQGGNSSMMATI